MALLAAGALLAGGCSDPGPPTDSAGVTLSVFWWGDQERAERTEAALALYSTRYPGVRFKITWQGEAGYYDRLATQAVGGNAPDLFQIDDTRLADYAERGLLLDLSAAVAAGRIDVTRFPAGLADYGRVDGRTVGVPAGTSTSAMVYNRSLVGRLGVEEPRTGMSYAELMTWAAGVSAKTGGDVAGTEDASGDLDAFWVWLRGQGRDLYRAQGLGFQMDDVARWFAMWQEARWDGAAPVTGPAARPGVLSGEAATAFGWSGDLAAWQSATRDELRLVAYPGDPRAQFARAAYFWAGYRGTRNPDAVADVLDFLANDPQAGRLLGHDRGFPPNLDVRAANRGAVPDGAALAFEDDLVGRLGPAPVPPPAGHARVRTLLADAASAVAADRMTSDEAAVDFFRRASAALAG